MAKDPAFLFYPGDYLRDTQCLSEAAQVAYDRIMCEHMRNICISQQQLNFFTKRLTPDEKEEVIMVLSKVEGGYQIHWGAESICKRREYSDSRRKNRSTPNKNISVSYDSHMDNENENVIEDVVKKENKYDQEIQNAFKLKIKKEENEKLVAEFGLDKTLLSYNYLSDYKAEKGYKTKSDYLTIRRWVMDAVNEKEKNGSKLTPITGNAKLGTSEARIERAKNW